MTRLFTTAIFLAAFALPSVSLAGDVAAGNEKFQALCVSCHGPGGQGDGPTGLALAAAGQPAPRDFTVGDFKLDTDKDGKADQWSKWQEARESYDYVKGFSKQVSKTPAQLDLSDLPAGFGFQVELKLSDTTANASKPLVESLELSLE